MCWNIALLFMLHVCCGDSSSDIVCANNGSCTCVSANFVYPMNLSSCTYHYLTKVQLISITSCQKTLKIITNQILNTTVLSIISWLELIGMTWWQEYASYDKSTLAQEFIGSPATLPKCHTLMRLRIASSWQCLCWTHTWYAVSLFVVCCSLV